MPFQLPADTNLSSPQIKLITEWNEGFLQLNVETLEKHLHKDFRRVAWFTPDLSPTLNKAKRSGLKKSQGFSALPLGLM